MIGFADWQEEPDAYVRRDVNGRVRARVRQQVHGWFSWESFHPDGTSARVSERAVRDVTEAMGRADAVLR